MADNNIEDMQENFQQISEVLDSIRAQNAMNAGSADKLLTSINSKLDSLALEENTDLIKVFLAEFKKGLEERHNFVSSKFSEIENSFKDLIEKAQGQLQAHEIKEVFEIIAGNFNNFSKDFSSQKELISELGLKIEEIQQDDSPKKEILKNISTLKVELEKFGNGFESIILNLNNNFKEVSQILASLDTSDELSGLKKDIDNVNLSSNAILSTLQVIDRKNRELEEVITHVVTKEDFNIEREQVAKLIAQNVQIAEYVNGLPTQNNLEDLSKKVDTSIGVINALKNMINETGKQNQNLLTAQLDNLESKILNISTEEEFIGFRKELSEFAKEVIQSTNLMRADLADTNAELKDLAAFLSSMEIKTTFENFSSLAKISEKNITNSIVELSSSVSDEIVKNRKITKTDVEDNFSKVNEKIESVKEELTEGSKTNLTSILEQIQSVINNIFSVKNSLHIENLENAEAIDNKFQELKENLTASNNFVLQTSQDNLDSIVENIERVYDEIDGIKTNLDDSSSKTLKNIGSGFNEISKKIGEIKNELSQNSQDSFANLVSIVEDFSQKLSVLKSALDETSQENSKEVKEVIESLSEKISTIQEVIVKNDEINSSEFKSTAEQLAKSIQTIKISLEQASSIGFAGLKSNIETLSEELKTLEENFDIKSQTNLSKIVVLFEDLTQEFNTHKAFLSESAQINFETVSLYIQNLTKKLDETKENFNEDLKLNFAELKDSISILPETIKENQCIFENEKKALIEENSKNIEEIGSKIQNLIKGLVNKENPFKSEVLYEFAQLQSNIETIRDFVDQSNLNLGESIQNKIESNLQDLENSIGEYNETYSSALISLQNKLVEYFESIQQTTQESDLKLDNSLKETSEIKSEIKSVLEQISELKDDTLFSELSVNISKKFEGILLNITQLEEISSVKNKTSFENILNALDEKFEDISNDLRSCQNLSTIETKEFVNELADKIETIKSQLSLANTDMISALESKIQEVSAFLLPLQASLDKITAIGVEELILSIKSKVEKSYFSITSALKDHINQENGNQFDRLVQEFETLNEKLESILLKVCSEDNDEFNQLKEILKEITSKIEDNEFFIEEFSSLKDSISDIKTQGSENYSSLNKSLKLLLEKLEGFNLSASIEDSLSSTKEALINKLDVLEDNLLLSQDENKTRILDSILQSQNEMKDSILEEFKEKFESAHEDSQTIILDNLVQSQNEMKESILEIKDELKENLDTVKEDYHLSTQTSMSKLLDSVSEKIFEQLECLQDKIESQDETRKEIKTEILEGITQLQEETETVILNELQENIKLIKEILSSVSPDEALTDELSKKVEDIDNKISDSIETYKTSTQSLLSEVKTSFYEKVDDSLDDLKSFIEVLEDKKDFSNALDGLKTEVFNKFDELSDNFETSINSISVKKDLEELNKEIEESLDNLFEKIEEKFISSINESEVIAGLSEKSEEINRRIEDLKKEVSEEVTEKLDHFELNFDTQNKDFSALIEEVKTSLAELKESYVDLSLNSTMEMSSLLVNVQEKVEGLEHKLENIDFSHIVENIENKFESLDFNQAIENSKNEIKEEFASISEKLDSLNTGSDSEMEENIREIKQIVQSQSDIAQRLEKLPDTDKVNSIKDEIQQTLHKFEEKLSSFSLEDLSEEPSSDEMKNSLNSFKEELLSSVINIFEQISFVSEAEDIKDFVSEQTEELNKRIGNVNYNYTNIINEIKEVKSKLEGDSDYSYTLQDVESDIAKVRIILNEIASSKAKGGSEPLEDFDTINEAIMSISSRTNKLLLTSDESYAALKSNLDDLRGVIYQFEEKVKYLDNKETINKVEKKLENVNNLMLSSVKSDKIFNQTFMYLAEWVDTASENLDSIIEKVSDIDSLKVSISEIKTSMPKRSDIETVLDEISDKFDKQQDRITALEEKLEKALAVVVDGGVKPDSKLAKKVDNIDKQLTKLCKGIEKLTSYVDEG